MTQHQHVPAHWYESAMQSIAEKDAEIERLSGLLAEWENHAGPYKDALIALLRAALKPFALLIETIECTTDHRYGDDAEWDINAGEYSIVKLGDLRRARAALKDTTP